MYIKIIGIKINIYNNKFNKICKKIIFLKLKIIIIHKMKNNNKIKQPISKIIVFYLK